MAGSPRGLPEVRGYGGERDTTAAGGMVDAVHSLLRASDGLRGSLPSLTAEQVRAAIAFAAAAARDDMPVPAVVGNR